MANAAAQDEITCPDCRIERPGYRVGCVGCMADLVREAEPEDWPQAIQGITRTWGPQIAKAVERKLVP